MTFNILPLVFIITFSVMAGTDDGRETLLNKAKHEGDGLKAFELYKSVISTGINDDYSEEARFRMGQFYYAEGDYLGAIREFDILLQNFSAGSYKSEAMFLKGISHLSLGNKDSALLIMSAVSEDDPAVFVKSRIVLGVIFSRDGKYAESNKYLETALKMGDNSLRSTGYFNLAKNYALMGDSKQSDFYNKKLKNEFPNAIEAPFSEIDGQESVKVKENNSNGTVLKEQYALQLGAFQNRENAEKLRKKYSDSYDNTDVIEIKRDKLPIYIVRLGLFNNQKDAENFALLELNFTSKNFKVIKR